MAACLGLYCVHYFYIWTYAIDVPTFDEWDTLPKVDSPAWFFAQHNEHRIVTTRILIWLLYKLDGWNLQVHQLINFFIYGLLLLAIVQVTRRFAPQVPAWVMAAFLIFLLSPVNEENHIWGFQTQWHFAVLFYLGAVYFLFAQRQTKANLALGTASAILALYSLSCAIAAYALLMGLYGAFKAYRARAGEGRHDIAQSIAVNTVLCLALACYFIDYQRSAEQLVLPTSLLFWNYLANLVSFGFGFETHSWVIGALCFGVATYPLIAAWRRDRDWADPAGWALLALALGTLAALAAITAGRAAPDLTSSKQSRYFEIAMLLLPVAVMAWGRLLPSGGRTQRLALAGLWLACCFSFADDWSLFNMYELRYKERVVGLQCIRDYYVRNGPGFCPTVRYTPLVSQLEEARRLNLSFYRTIHATGKLESDQYTN